MKHSLCLLLSKRKNSKLRINLSMRTLTLSHAQYLYNCHQPIRCDCSRLMIINHCAFFQEDWTIHSTEGLLIIVCQIHQFWPTFYDTQGSCINATSNVSTFTWSYWYCALDPANSGIWKDSRWSGLPEYLYFRVYLQRRSETPVRSIFQSR